MNIGLIGLGRMGLALITRWRAAGLEVIAFDVDKGARSAGESRRAKVVDSVAQVAHAARVIWLMVPAGKVNEVLEQLLPSLQKGDIVIDGGNSKFSDSIVRANRLQEYGIFFLDCGTSGGLKGEEIGFSLMVGGDKSAYDKVEPIFDALAAPGGYGYMGPSGTGHYVKMIHNGIEYALLQSYAQGFHLLKQGRFEELDLELISRVWMNGSVIRSWILELAHSVFLDDQELHNISGELGHTGMGAWTVEEAQTQNISVDLIKRALDIRLESERTGGDYSTKLVALLRNKFGGHPVKNI